MFSFMKTYIGCSGFLYPYWREKFYPKDVPQRKWLEYYSSHFNTVELNGTFYRFPTVKNLKVFYNSTPPGFRFAVKAQKIITHTLRMNNAAEKVKEFAKIVEEGLEEKLGCTLYQLPPSFQYSGENLEKVITSLAGQPRPVVEFRHPSWWQKPVYNTLKKHGLIFCNNDYPGMPDEIVPTKGLFYMRFHGRPVLYKSEYDISRLKEVAEQATASADRYVYFNNTWFMAAVSNAKEMQKLMV
jgi:uncharacterized protein YecE (DUF72 family)